METGIKKKKGQGKMERKMNNGPQKTYKWNKRKRGKINPERGAKRKGKNKNRLRKKQKRK